MNKWIKVFNENVQQLGDSMSKMDREFSDDIQKSNTRSKIQERKNIENLDKLLGKEKPLW